MRVVLLHGLTNSSRAFDRLRPLLGDHDVVTPDLPGHGSNAASPGARSVAAMADAIIDDIDGPSVILGHHHPGHHRAQRRAHTDMGNARAGGHRPGAGRRLTRSGQPGGREQ